MPESHRHSARILEKEGEKEQWFLLPPAGLRWAPSPGTGRGAGYPSGAEGPRAISSAVSLPAELSAAGAAGREGGNEGWEDAELPQSSLPASKANADLPSPPCPPPVPQEKKQLM